MHLALASQTNVDRLHIPKMNSRRRMISVIVCVKMKKYIESSNEILLNAVEAEGIVESGNTKKEVSEARKKNFMGKPLHSQFMRETDEKRSQETWNWLNKGKLKKEREGMLMAAQDQGLGTNKITSKVTNSFSPLVVP